MLRAIGAAEHYTPAASSRRPMEVGPVTFEIEIPDEWPPSLGFAVAKMIRQSLEAGFPVVVPVRSDATPDQLAAAFNTVQTVIQKAGLAA